MNVEIGAEAALFPGMEYINGIAVAVWNRCFQESFSQRNGFPQGINSMESMPGVLKSLKILALTYAGEVAVELSAHTLQ
jgi:hypothetical protein